MPETQQRPDTAGPRRALPDLSGKAAGCVSLCVSTCVGKGRDGEGATEMEAREGRTESDRPRY